MADTWSDAELKQALRESMESAHVRFGTPLSPEASRNQIVGFLDDLWQIHMFLWQQITQGSCFMLFVSSLNPFKTLMWM